MPGIWWVPDGCQEHPTQESISSTLHLSCEEGPWWYVDQVPPAKERWAVSSLPCWLSPTPTPPPSSLPQISVSCSSHGFHYQTSYHPTLQRVFPPGLYSCCSRCLEHSSTLAPLSPTHHLSCTPVQSLRQLRCCVPRGQS